jgi:hypothetical protein
MPRVSASNGIRPEIRALAVLQLGKTVTPKEINDHVGTGEYAAKYVSFLNTRYGFNITANKDGRKVVSYTMIAEPANAAELRGATPKATKAKTVKLSTIVKKVNKKFTTAKALGLTTAEAKEVRAEVAADKEAIKAKNLETLKKVAAERNKTAAKSAKKAKRVPRESDYIRDTFGSTGEIATSYNVDADWDSVEGLDLQKLVG